MKHVLVRPDGSLGRSWDFDTPPVIPATKGRWLSDTPPVYDATLFRIAPKSPMPETATTIEYDIIPLDIEPVRETKRMELKAARDIAIVANVTIGARVWPGDEEFKRRILLLISRAGRGKPAIAQLKPISGPAIPVPTLVQLETIEDSLFSQEISVQDRYDTLITTLDAATTVAQINAIVW